MTTAIAGPRQRSGVLLWVLRVVGAALLGAMGWIHLDLWEEGYRTIEVIGLGFLLNAVAGVGLAVLLLATTVGLFGFHESPDASLWWESLRVEVAAVVVLTALAALSGGRRRG